MNEVKTITENGYTLNHTWYLDDLGLRRNSFDISFLKNGMVIHFPFYGDLRVNNYERDKAYIGDDISPYTDEEYIKMLREQKERLKQK